MPCAYWFSSMWGLKGIWVAYALAFVSLCIIQGLYYQFIWKKKKIKVLI
ncbi:MATE family efflux transporter, partial [Acinetobacter baumannii]